MGEQEPTIHQVKMFYFTQLNVTSEDGKILQDIYI